MRKLMSVVAVGTLLVACAPDAPGPAAAFDVAVYSHGSAASSNANGGNFGTPLSGAEEVPARATRARGNAIFHLNAAGDALSYKLIVANIENAFMAHIHRGGFGANGGIVVWLFPSTAPAPGPVAQGRLNGVIAEGTITAANLVGALAGQPLSALVAELENANAYVNVHTSDGEDPANTGPGDFPGGEVRGQIEHRGH